MEKPDRYRSNPLPLPFRLVWCPAGPTITKPLAGDQLTTAASTRGSRHRRRALPTRHPHASFSIPLDTALFRPPPTPCTYITSSPRALALVTVDRADPHRRLSTSSDGGGPPRTFLLPALRVRRIPPLLDLSLLSSAAALQTCPPISPLRRAVTDQPPRPCPLLRRRRRPLRAPVLHHGYPPHSPVATGVLILILFLFWVRPDHLGVFGWVATRNSYESILTTLRQPGGGDFGKYYSLPALTDPRIGKDFDDFRCEFGAFCC